MLTQKIARSNATSGSGGNLGQGAYVEELFSTYAYFGTGTTNRIYNNIDLLNEGGLVIIKARDGSGDKKTWFIDTARGSNKAISTCSDTVETTTSSGITSFNSDGFTLGSSSDIDVNVNGTKYICYTFRKKQKFFDTVTFTAASSGSTYVSHNLRTNPGFLMIKALDNTEDWKSYTDIVNDPSPYYLKPNSTSGSTSIASAPGLSGTLVAFGSEWLTPGKQYIMYIFPRTASGFGDNSSSDIMVSTSGSLPEAGVSLRFEPEFVLLKYVGYGNWNIIDDTRNFSSYGSGAHTNRTGKLNTLDEQDESIIEATPTGFKPIGGGLSGTYTYLAVRRGSMRTPTVANTVFDVSLYTGNGTTQTINPNFKTDMSLIFNRDGTIRGLINDRKRGRAHMRTSSTQPTSVNSAGAADLINYLADNNSTNTYKVDGQLNYSSNNYVSYSFKRAPKFFDIVTYRGTGSSNSPKHNLNAVPELIIVRAMTSGVQPWTVYCSEAAYGSYYPYESYLTFTNSPISYATSVWGAPPTISNFTVASSAYTNGVYYDYIAYLFASCPGVSKVGSYIGNGTVTPREINCGFAAGARFVLIKAFSSVSAPWLVFDTSRGMTSGGSYYLILSNTGGVSNDPSTVPEEVALWIQTSSLGFTITTTNSYINSPGQKYLYLAIA